MGPVSIQVVRDVDISLLSDADCSRRHLLGGLQFNKTLVRLGATRDCALQTLFDVF